MPGRRSDPGVLADMETAISTVPRPGLVELLWNWRHELLVAAALAGPLTAIGLILGAGWLVTTTVAEAVLFAGLLASPPARRLVIAWAWCVITSHRIRTGCRHAWVQSRDGRLPVVLRTRPSVSGERALIWCRAGIVPDDFAAAKDVIAAACWAYDVRVAASQRWRHMVTLEVVRREPPAPAPAAEPGTWPYLTQAEDPEEPATAAIGADS
jgi:hypothetical protein